MANSNTQHHPEQMTIIGIGSDLKADINSKNVVRIEGNLDGNIQSDDLVIISETGKTNGKIKSKSIQVSGRVYGDIISSNLIHLNKTAEINGNIHADKLIVEDGAIINGSVNTTKQADQKEEKKKTTSFPEILR